MNEIQTKAIRKLNKELDESKEAYASPIIEHIKKRCEEDAGMAEDVIGEDKSFKDCFLYIKNKAKELAKGNSAVVADTDVYEWAEDYYRAEKGVSVPAAKASGTPANDPLRAAMSEREGKTREAEKEVRPPMTPTRGNDRAPTRGNGRARCARQCPAARGNDRASEKDKLSKAAKSRLTEIETAAKKKKPKRKKTEEIPEKQLSLFDFM